MFSSRVTVRVIFAITLVILIAQTLVAEKQMFRNLNYSTLNDIKVMNFTLQLRNGNGTFLCAGSLIAPQYAITAADCFHRIDFTTTVVVAGATTLTQEGTQRQIIKLSKYPTKHINIAVLKLNATLSDFDHIRLADNSVEELPENTSLRLVGWRHLTRRKSATKLLHTVRSKIAPQGECEIAFYAAGTKKQFCLEGSGYDDQPCCADAGGPALFEDKLFGIVSKGHKCSDPEYLISVTSVFDVLPFITESMK